MSDLFAARGKAFDRDVLFGVVAVQADFINADQFQNAHSLWMKCKERPLEEVLQANGWLTASASSQVARLVERKLKKHDGDICAALNEATGASLRQTLNQELDASLSPGRSGENALRSVQRMGGTLWTWLRRVKPRGAVNTAAMVVLILTFCTIAAMLLFPSTNLTRSDSQNGEDDSSAATALQRDEEYRKALALEREKNYPLQISAVAKAWQDDEPQRMRDLLNLQQPQRAGDRDLRCFEWKYLRHLNQAARLDLAGHRDLLNSLAFSPDGRHLASGSLDCTVRIWDAIIGEEILTLEVPSSRSLEDSWLAPPPSTSQVKALAYNPKGSNLAIAYGDGTLRIWDVVTGKELRSIPAHGEAVSSVAYSPDGKHLATASFDHTVKIWDANSDVLVRELRNHQDQVYKVVFNADGTRLASVGKDRVVYVWDVATGNIIRSINDKHDDVVCAAFNRDGSLLASSTKDGSIKVWDINTEPKSRLITGSGKSVTGLAFSPDGRRLASVGSEGDIKLWDLVSCQKVYSFKGGAFNCLAFSPDGLRLAAGSSAKMIAIWESVRPPAELAHSRYARDLVESLFVADRIREDVLELIELDQTLSEPVRREARARAERHRENPEALNNRSWEVVRVPGHSPSAYQAALRQSREASRQLPDNGYMLNTLGVAQYRVGLYSEAVATLTKSDKINSARTKRSLPEDLAFLAMAHFRLGHKEEAARFMQKLDQTKTRIFGFPPQSAFVQVKAIREEAKDLLHGAAGQ